MNRFKSATEHQLPLGSASYGWEPFKSDFQGDFSDHEMEILRQIQPHFERVAQFYAERTRLEAQAESLQSYIRTSPSAFVLLDWALGIIHVNGSARWQSFQDAGGDAKEKPEKNFRLPVSILTAVQNMKEALLAKTKTHKATSTTVDDQYRISFLPGRKGSMYPGSFVISRISSKTTKPLSPHAAKLTRCELQVFKLLATGLSNKSIAEILSKSVATVKSQIQSMYQKTRSKSRTELVKILTELSEADQTVFDPHASP